MVQFTKWKRMVEFRIGLFPVEPEGEVKGLGPQANSNLVPKELIGCDISL